jgi:PAS domain S-box-containing protein
MRTRKPPSILRASRDDPQLSFRSIRALLESAPQAIFAVNRAGNIVLANRATKKLFGYRPNELLGKLLDRLVPPGQRKDHSNHRARFFAKPRSRPMGIGLDLCGCRKDRNLFPVEISLGSIDTPEGRLAIAFVSDITERKRLEAAVQQDHEQIRALASRLLTAQEEERRRVSREIHDDFCQELAAVAFDLGEQLSVGLPEATRSRLEELQSRLSTLSVAARNLAYQLHPSTLEDLGLPVALRALCEEFSHRNGLAVQFRKGAVPQIPIEVASCLYRVAQESLWNAIKHSSAKRVVVNLGSNRKDVTLSVRDDGAGFDFHASRRKGGLGLASMEERVRLVDGSLSIKSEPGRGTRITATVPLARSRS